MLAIQYAFPALPDKVNPSHSRNRVFEACFRSMFPGIKVPRSLSESDDKQASAFFPGNCGFLGDYRLAQTSSAAAPRVGPLRPQLRHPLLPLRLGPAPSWEPSTLNKPVMGSNEGQRDFEVLRKKLEPKQSELKGQNDELESLQETTADSGRQVETTMPALPWSNRSKLRRIPGACRPGFSGRCAEPAERNFPAHPAEDGSGHRKARAGWRLRHGDGYLQPLAAEAHCSGMASKATSPKQVVDIYNAQSGIPAQRLPAQLAGRRLRVLLAPNGSSEANHTTRHLVSRHRVCRESSQKAAPPRGLFIFLSSLAGN